MLGTPHGLLMQEQNQLLEQYSGDKNELQATDRKTRKLLTMYRSLHPRANVDRLYWKRKNGGKGLTSVEECVRIEKTSLGFLPERTRTTTTTEVVIEGVISDDENPKMLKRSYCNNTKKIMLRKEYTLHS